LIKPKTLTRDEFYAQYGDVLVVFSNYYKYTFTYDAILSNGNKLVVNYGGDAAEIYRHEVSRDHQEIVKHLHPYAGAEYNGQEQLTNFYD
jgi:hypothetical protein